MKAYTCIYPKSIYIYMLGLKPMEDIYIYM